MSFTSNVKNEVCLIEGNKNEKIAELSAIVRNNAIYDKEKIEITTENSKVAKRIYLLFKEFPVHYRYPVSGTSNDGTVF